MKYEISGYNTNELLRKLYLKKIPIRNLNFISKSEIEFEIDDKFDKRIRKYIANFKTKKTPKLLRQIPIKIMSNLGIILAVFFGIIIYLFSSVFTYDIRVYGLNNLSKNDIISVLEKNNIKKYKINHFSSSKIEEILLNNYDRIAQVSVVKLGTSIIINLSEKLVYDDEIFSPILAKYSGIVESVNVLTGTTNVKVGDYVNVGDTLVLPFNINANGEKISVKPVAEIYGSIIITSRAELRKTEISLIESGRTITEYHYKLKNLSLFSGKNKNSFALFTVSSYNENISDLIPLVREKCVYHELVETEVTHDFSLEKDDLIVRTSEMAHANLPMGEILDESSAVTIVGDLMYATTTITMKGQING